ncbi:hypothetical protein ES702_00758 [subsurface metagenome]
MSEEEKETITIKIKLPTTEKIVETLRAIFPGITVEVQGKEKEEAEATSEETEETHVDP